MRSVAFPATFDAHRCGLAEGVWGTGFVPCWGFGGNPQGCWLGVQTADYGFKTTVVGQKTGCLTLVPLLYPGKRRLEQSLEDSLPLFLGQAPEQLHGGRGEPNRG